MAFTTYQDLLDSVKNWIDRDDLTTITPDFVVLAEVRINADLKLQALDKSSTIAVSVGVTSYDLPADMVRLIRVEDANGQNVEMISPDDMMAGGGFYIEAGKLWLRNAPLEPTTLTIYYKAKALNLANEINPIYTKYPNIYLYGTLKEMAVFVGDDRNIGIYDNEYIKAIAQANKEENYKKKAVLGSEITRLIPSTTYDIRVE